MTGTATVIDRTNPLIINMAAAVYIDEWTLDDVFGVTWPAPDSAAGRGFAWARANPRPVTLTATWAVSVLLVILGGLHLV